MNTRSAQQRCVVVKTIDPFKGVDIPNEFKRKTRNSSDGVVRSSVLEVNLFAGRAENAVDLWAKSPRAICGPTGAARPPWNLLDWPELKGPHCVRSMCYASLGGLTTKD